MNASFIRNGRSSLFHTDPDQCVNVLTRGESLTERSISLAGADKIGYVQSRSGT